MSKDKLIVSVVIPALNEQNAIQQVISELPMALVHEIIVVDNGSTDHTPKVAREKGARVFFEPIKGYGRAVKCGLSHLSPDSNVIVILDADHSDYPEELPRLLNPIEAGEADMVIGSRTQNALPDSLTWAQRFGNWLTVRIIQRIYDFKFTDLGPFRAIRRSALNALNMQDNNFGWNVEMQIKSLQLGFRIKEISARYRPRIGKSKISGTIKGTIHAGFIILWSIFYYGFIRRAK